MSTNEFPADWPDWPEGGDLFAKLARRCRVDITFEQLRSVADLLFGTPYVPGWQPIAGQDARSILIDEATTMAMLVQAWTDRADWALTQCSDDEGALRNYSAAGRVLHSALRHVPGRRSSEDGEDSSVNSPPSTPVDAA